VRPKFIEIEGKRYAWADILSMRREQLKALRSPQLTLFQLRDDSRPAAQKTASGRYESPTLFDDRPTGKGH
jgi:hypothetical protein